MTREEAIETINRNCTEGSKLREACAMFIPELSKSDDESVRKSIIHLLQVGGYMSLEDKEKAFAYLEKMKEASKAIEAVDRIDKYIDENVANAHDMKDSNPDKKYYIGVDDTLSNIAGILNGVYSEEKQKEQKPSTEETELNSIAFLEQMGYTCIPPKEQKPILEVFGFKVGDTVRLKDGDGRKHIIKSFEEVEGLHGPNFYHVEFEDNSARSGIYTGEEYPNGYYTQMEKFKEEQKPIEPSDDELQRHQDELYAFKVFAAKQAKEYHISYVHDFEWNNFCAEILSYFNEQKPTEWSEEDEKMIDKICHAILVSTYHEKGLTLSEMNQCQSWMHNLSQKAVPSNKRDRWLISRALEYVSMSNENDELKKEIKVCLERRQPQYHWKPSVEQMDALDSAINYLTEHTCTPGNSLLISLFTDLQKLP